MAATDSSFAGKFLRKIRKVDTEQIESFLAQLLREKAFLEVVFDSLTEGVLVTEQGMRIVFSNEAARLLLGIRRDVHGKDLRRVLKNEDLKTIAEEFQETLKPIRQREIVLEHPARRRVAVTIVPIEDENGLTTHSVWVLSDRTEAERLAGERQQIENLQSLATLTAGVAHEVKNPLNSLNIHAQIMAKCLRDLAPDLKARNGAVLERLERSNAVLQEEIQRLARVVDDFTKAVRPVNPSLRKAPLNRVLESLAELVGPDCVGRRIELVFDLDPELPPLLIDPEQIQQALLNILKNAMEAIDKPRGLIRVRSVLKSDHALIEVQDNGCGIAEEDRLRIFEPYHTTKFNGTGLGLMVVYRIVRAHRGAIGLTSKLGSGTSFSIALPLDERPVRLLEAQVEPELELDPEGG